MKDLKRICRAAVVQAEPVLFNKSIRENLIFGREEQLRQLGNLDDLIQKENDEFVTDINLLLFDKISCISVRITICEVVQ